MTSLETTPSPAPHHGPAAPAEPKPSAHPENQPSKNRISRNRKPKNEGGRPPKMNAKTVSKLEEAYKCDFTNEEAWDHAGISKATYYRHYKADNRFRDRMDRAQRYALTLAKKTMMKQIEGTKDKAGDGNLAMRLLERRQPERYRTKVETDPPVVLPPMTIILPGSRPHPRITPPAAPPEK